MTQRLMDLTSSNSSQYMNTTKYWNLCTETLYSHRHWLTSGFPMLNFFKIKQFPPNLWHACTFWFVFLRWFFFPINKHLPSSTCETLSSNGWKLVNIDCLIIILLTLRKVAFVLSNRECTGFNILNYRFFSIYSK